MNKPQSYWEKRKARELYEELVKAEDTAEEMRQLYIASSNKIKEEAVKLARRFQLRHNLSVKEAERLLARAVDPEDIKHLIEMLKQDPQNTELAAELESQAYASRINRLMAVQSSIDTVATEIYRRSNAATTAVLQDIGQSMYYKQIFELQQRAGAAFGFMPLDPDRLMSIISRRWSGQNFSERLWANRGQLAVEVKKQLLLGILTGRANRKMAQEIDGRFSVSYNNTRRLVRTEANYVANQLQVESYKDTSVDRYIYVAILDLRTSEICQELDKKRFLLANAKVGENYPPMHPWCRSTTIAWMPDQLLKKLQQSAIDPATGETITVPGDMTYREWYDKYAREDHGGSAELTHVGSIDPDKYKSAVRGKLRGSGVIITKKQIAHIDERRGTGFYDNYASEFSKVVEDPDLILEDAKRENSVLAIRKIDNEDKHLVLAMHLATTKDLEGRRSSIITAMRITDKRLARYQRSNKVVYSKT